MIPMIPMTPLDAQRATFNEDRGGTHPQPSHGAWTTSHIALCRLWLSLYTFEHPRAIWTELATAHTHIESLTAHGP